MSAEPPEPTELIYLPGSSWAPVLVAAGVVLALAGAFIGWAFSVIGGLILLAGLRSWWKQGDDEISRMRREQQPDTAVIPAAPIRHR
jgi:hypothetical protein